MNIFENISKESFEVKNIIHGTDWWTDCDDVVAMRILARAHKIGLINLLGISADAVKSSTAASIDAFLLNEGVKCEIGIDREFVPDKVRENYQEMLINYPHNVENADCIDSVKLYRKCLASCEGKVNITEVGFLQVLHKLLLSGPDEYSPLNGTELVKQKVETLWLMAGKWDVQGGKEYNIVNTPESRRAAAYICENCPVPVAFLGFEIGCDVLTGQFLSDDDMLKKAININKNGRPSFSWDPMLCLLAVLGAEKAGYDLVRGKASVNPESGENYFEKCDDGNHFYVVRREKPEYYSDMINSLIE